MRLLETSRQAAHNTHDNEMLSIIEELRETGIITDYYKLIYVSLKQTVDRCHPYRKNVNQQILVIRIEN